ncbi:MAG: hypothetical protein ABSE48_00065 [Verrucomicrobiota bacterium]
MMTHVATRGCRANEMLLQQFAPRECFRGNIGLGPEQFGWNRHAELR